MTRNRHANYAALQWMARSPDGVAIMPDGSAKQQSSARSVGGRPRMWAAPISATTRMRMIDAGWIERVGDDPLIYRITGAGRAYVAQRETEWHGRPITP